MDQDLVTLSILTVMTALLRKKQKERDNRRAIQQSTRRRSKERKRKHRKLAEAARAQHRALATVPATVVAKQEPNASPELVHTVDEDEEPDDYDWSNGVEYETFIEPADEEEHRNYTSRIAKIERVEDAQEQEQEPNEEVQTQAEEETEEDEENDFQDEEKLDSEEHQVTVDDMEEANATGVDVTGDYEVSTAIDEMTQSLESGDHDTPADEVRDTMTKSGKPRAKRSAWCREYLLLRHYGQDIMTNSEFDLKDPVIFKEFARMSMESFAELLELVGPLIKKKPTSMRPAISPRVRLLVALRYLATGDKYCILEKLFRVSLAAISNIIAETLPTIYYVLKDNFFTIPQTASEWATVAEEFQTKWDFPQCLGALDGVHISIKDRKTYNGCYRNYQGQHSVVLFAIVDANYRFLHIKTATNVAIQDPAAIMEDVLLNEELDYPSEGQLPGYVDGVPFAFAGNDAFKLTNRLLTPYTRATSNSDQVFNSRLSRANHVAEQAFGLLANSFHILKMNMDLPVEKVETIVLAACTLHNFIRTRENANSADAGTDASAPWRDTGRMMGLQLSVIDNEDDEYSRVRNIYSEYFSTMTDYLWE